MQSNHYRQPLSDFILSICNIQIIIRGTSKSSYTQPHSMTSSGVCFQLLRTLPLTEMLLVYTVMDNLSVYKHFYLFYKHIVHCSAVLVQALPEHTNFNGFDSTGKAVHKV